MFWPSTSTSTAPAFAVEMLTALRASNVWENPGCAY
jgi:hypothetical protein